MSSPTWTAVFFPNDELDCLFTTSLSFIQDELISSTSLPDSPPTIQVTPRSSYCINDFALFKPKYHARPVLVPRKGTRTPGNLLLVSQDRFLTIMDAALEENKVLARLNATIVPNNTPYDLCNDAISTQVYAWHGNCLAGEWEYLSNGV